MSRKTPIPAGYTNEHYREGSKILHVDYICATCNTTKSIPKCKAAKKSHMQCDPCYRTSPEMKAKLQQMVKDRPDFSGSSNPNFRGRIQTRTCQCGQEFTRSVFEKDLPNKHKYCSSKCRAQFSISIAEPVFYKEIKMRSSWEVAIAQELDNRGLDWVYEPQSFETPYGFYTPDFYVPSWKAFLEVKGAFRDDESKAKFEYFSSIYYCLLVDKDNLPGFGYSITHGKFIKAGHYVNRPRISTVPSWQELFAGVK